MIMSRPRDVGQTSEEVIFRRDGDHLTVIKPEETRRHTD
jgi:hypothetical protein